jgi:hypothetical protein
MGAKCILSDNDPQICALIQVQAYSIVKRRDANIWRAKWSGGRRERAITRVGRDLWPEKSAGVSLVSCALQLPASGVSLYQSSQHLRMVVLHQGHLDRRAAKGITSQEGQCAGRLVSE